MPPPRPLAGDKPQPYISLLRPWAVVVRATVVGVAGRRRNPSRIGVRGMRSYQSLMPAVADTPRYENWVHRSIEGFRCLLCPPPRPLAGDKPQPYISLLRPWAVCCSGDGGWCRRPVPESIPDRSPGHAFVPKPFAYIGSRGLPEQEIAEIGRPTPRSRDVLPYGRVSLLYSTTAGPSTVISAPSAYLS